MVVVEKGVCLINLGSMRVCCRGKLKLIILFEGSSGLDNPKQCLITMTIFSSLVLHSMPTANKKSFAGSPSGLPRD